MCKALNSSNLRNHYHTNTDLFQASPFRSIEEKLAKSYLFLKTTFLDNISEEADIIIVTLDIKIRTDQEHSRYIGCWNVCLDFSFLLDVLS